MLVMKIYWLFYKLKAVLYTFSWHILIFLSGIILSDLWNEYASLDKRVEKEYDYLSDTKIVLPFYWK